MILRFYTGVVVCFTTALLILSVLSIPHILEIIIIGLGAIVCLLIIAMASFLNKVNTRYEHALSSDPRSETDVQ